MLFAQLNGRILVSSDRQRPARLLHLSAAPLRSPEPITVQEMLTSEVTPRGQQALSMIRRYYFHSQEITTEMDATISTPVSPTQIQNSPSAWLEAAR